MLLTILTSTVAAQPVILTDKIEQAQPGHSLEILKDPTKRLTFDDVRLSTEFRPSNQSIPNLGFTYSAFWIRLSLSNSSSHQDWIFQFDFPLVEDFRIFLLQGNELVDIYQTGMYTPPGERRKRHHTFLYPMKLEPASLTTVYLRLETRGGLRVPIKIWQPDAFHLADLKENFTLGLFYGSILIMFLYNLFIFLSTRIRLYLYYILCAMLIGIFFLIQNGYALLIYPELGGRWLDVNRVVIPTYGLVLCFFVRAFLDLPRLAPRINRIVWGLIVLALAGIVPTPFVPYQLFIRFYAPLVLLVVLTSLVSGIFLAERGYKPARIFIITWTAFLMSIALAVFRSRGWVPLNAFTIHALQVGHVLELVLFSFALADRFNFLRLQLQAAHADAEKTNIQLREEVEQRKLAEKYSLEQQRALAAHMQDAVEQERRSISADIHDELGGAVTSLNINLMLHEQKIGHGNPSSEMLLKDTESMKSLSKLMMESVRALVRRLRPEVLSLGLLEALKWQLQELKGRTGLECTLHSKVESVLLDEDCAIAVFRIVQESLTNIVRHAHARKVTVLISKDNHNFVFEVADDGIGIQENEKLKSFGILGMKERALLFGGSVEIISAPNQGTTVRISVPIETGEPRVE